MMFLPLRFLSVLFLLLLLSIGYSDNYALVIGNSNYPSPNNLRNPRNDAEDLAKALRSIGFNVSAYYDLGEAEMQNRIVEFSRQLSSDDIALFYFAGHGTQFQSQNYLIPVDANFNSPETLIYDSIKANDIVATIENTSSAVNIIIIDACRNPVFAANTVRTGARGLAPMNAGRGTLIAFSTSPGEVAYDGYGRNSPYVEQLKELIINLEMDVEEIFRQTRYRVFEATANYSRGSQQPEERNRLSAPVYLHFPAASSSFLDSLYTNTLIDKANYSQIRGAVGLLEVMINRNGSIVRQMCTATLINENHIITANHCFKDIESAVLHMGYDQNSQQSSYTANPIPVNPIPVYIDTNLDYAILSVEGFPGRDFGFVDVRHRRTPYNNEDIFMVHHPEGQPKTIDNCSVLSLDSSEGPMKYQCNSFPGSGGALIFSVEDNALLGIHIGRMEHGDDSVRIGLILGAD